MSLLSEAYCPGLAQVLNCPILSLRSRDPNHYIPVRQTRN